MSSSLKWPRCEPGAVDAGLAHARGGVPRGQGLFEALARIPFRDRDTWVDALLGLEPPPPDMPNLPVGVVPYLPCSVEEILTAVREAPLHAHDELVDLGSGLGRVVMLAHLLTGARAVGIELQEHLVASARGHADRLGLNGVSFVHANAADVQLDGSVFFLHAPCNGELLARVLGRLEEVAQRRRIVVCAVGLELHGRSWLRPRVSSRPALALYDGGVDAR